MDTLSLTDFVLARITDDETIARASEADYKRYPGAKAQTRSLLEQQPHGILCGWRLGEGMARACSCGWPARVLADCEAKRRIVETVDPADLTGDMVVRLLALPHADHRDYRNEWRP